MSTFAHSRNASEDTVSSGSSYGHILEHVLHYSETYEMPLRTMYTLNCAPRAQPLPSQSRSATPTNSPPASPTSGQFPSLSDPAAHFTSSLMTQIAQLPTQQCSLPPAFITSFVRKTFPPVLAAVDFPQGLAALDYLKDLETRRKREMAAALQRLEVDPERLAGDNTVSEHSEINDWVDALRAKDTTVEQFYSQLYISLRKWILINELMLTPFSKHNCLAMLNTLYPPVVATAPTKLLSAKILLAQRDGFFKYIQGVQKSGPRVLRTLMEQGKREGEENGWCAVHEHLDSYLRTTIRVIEDCKEITDIDSLVPQRKRKVDSGISFGSNTSSHVGEKRPSTGDSASTNIMKPLPASPPLPESPRIAPTAPPAKSLSKLEKLTRELRRMRNKRVEIEEIVPRPASSIKNEKKPRGLRKMRSLGALGNHSSISLAGGRKPNDGPAFDKEEMSKQRSRYEAKVNAGNHEV